MTRIRRGLFGALLWSGAALAQAALPPDHPQLPPNHPSLGAPMAPESPAPDPQAAAEAAKNEQLIAKLDAQKELRDRDNPFHIAYDVGRLYYSAGRFRDAIFFLSRADQKAEPLRALYLSQLAKAKAQGRFVSPTEDSQCTPTAQTGLEPVLAQAQARVQKQDAQGAASCARAGLRDVIHGEQLLANALFLEGDTDPALAALGRVLEVSPDDTEALYAKGSILLEQKGDDVGALKDAKAAFERFLRVYPTSPRADRTKALIAQADAGIAQGGLTMLARKKAEAAHNSPVLAQAMKEKEAPPMGPFAGGQGPMQQGPMQGGDQASAPQISPEAMAAIQNTERTPEMEAGLAKLVEEGEHKLAQGAFQDALDDYKRVVPFQPQNGRAKAGMAWALVGLGKPMAERVWQVAVGSDPAAVDELGDTLQKLGDGKGAKAVWQRLAQSDPGYASKANLAKKLQ